MNALNIHISPCPNDTFAFGALILKKIPWNGPALNFSFMDIQNLNESGLSQNKPDILKFSYAILPRLQKNYILCNYGSALGKGVGPLLIGYGSKSLEQRKRIFVPGMDTTATLLCKKYAPSHIPLEMLSYDKILKRLENDEDSAGVIIHESRFSYQNHNLNLLLDLGGKWEETTKCPLPLGGIVLKKSLSDSIKKDFSIALKNSIHWAWKNTETIRPLIKGHAQELSDTITQQHIDLYVNDDTSGLSTKGIQAIKELCDLKDLSLFNTSIES